MCQPRPSSMNIQSVYGLNMLSKLLMLTRMLVNLEASIRICFIYEDEENYSASIFNRLDEFGTRHIV